MLEPYSKVGTLFKLKPNTCVGALFLAVAMLQPYSIGNLGILFQYI